MKIYEETSTQYFDFWAGARETAEELTTEEFERIDEYIEENYPNGIGKTELNDMFWFDDDFIAEILGYDDFDDLKKKHKHQGL